MPGGEPLTVVLCVAWHTVHGEHLPQCTDHSCTGCLPAKATRGLHVCTGHELEVRRNVRDLPGLWADLGDTRRSAGGDHGGRGAGDPEACPRCDNGQPCDVPHRSGHEALSPARLDARHAIRSTLVTWCRLLHEQHLAPLPAHPPNTVRWMAHHLAVNVGRILTRETLAELLVADLLGAWIPDDDEAGRTWRPGLAAHRALLDVHRPAGVRVRCPACESWVRLRDDDTITRCTGTLADGSPCTEWGTVEHWRTLVAADAGRPMTAPDLVDWLWRTQRYRVSEDTIRQWASRGTRHGRLTKAAGEDGIERFDPVRAAELVMLLRGTTTRLAQPAV